MRVKIEVTQRDISRGKRSGCTQCPVALAATRAFRAAGILPRGEHAAVFGDHMSVRLFRDVSLPLKAENFVYTFDTQGPSAVVPFSFVVQA